jgi:mRNA interferase MazF
MEAKQREIVLIPYPFTNYKGAKVRPGIIISNNNHNSRSQDCIMIAVTAAINNEPHSIMLKQEDLESGKLKKQSQAKADKVLTIEKSLIIKKIGMINNKTFEKIKAELTKIIS